MNISKSLIIKVSLGLIISILLGSWIYLRVLKENDSPLPQETSKTLQDTSLVPQVYPLTTTVTATTKTTPTDPDVVLKQTYTAEVNGKTVTVPIKEVPGVSSKNGSPQGVITQQIDVTPVIQQALKASQKNWEVSTGLGVHEGDFYIPVGLQRNLSHNQAIAIEIHLDPQDKLNVTGGEVKKVWKF